MPTVLGPRLGALLAASSLLAACGSSLSDEPREEALLPAPVWARPEAHLAVALAPEAIRGTPSGQALVQELLELLRERLPELAGAVERGIGDTEAPALFAFSMGWREDGGFWFETGPAAHEAEGAASRALSAPGPEPVAALVHLLPARLPPEALAGLPEHLRRLVRSLRRVALTLRAGEELALSGRAEAIGEREAASLASILRGLAESSGAGARARGEALLAEALEALRIDHRGPVVILEAELGAEQARALLDSAGASP